MWNSEATYSLLEKVRKEEVLWNIKHSLYHKKIIKRTLFDKISSELMSEYPQLLGLTTGDIMNKFQYLRGQYQKILRKIKNTPSGSGTQNPEKWEFFSSCSFLQSVYDNCPTESGFMHSDDLNTMSKKRRIDSDDSSAASTSKQDHTPKSVPLVHKRPEATSTPISTCCLSHDGQPVLTPSWSRSKSKQTPGSQHSKHQTLILKGLLEDATFADVTLTAEGKSLKAHKAVLSAMSPYFKRVLQNNPSPHPIIIMPLDMQFEDLKGIIDYIYIGDITVATENLSSLFKAARVLQISGLSAIDAIGVRSSDILLSSSNANSTSKDNVNTAVSTGTSQVCLRIRRNVNTNKLQTSDGGKKSTASSPIAMRNLAPAKRLEQRHKGASSFVPALETVDPLDTNNQKRPESVASSDGQIRYKCSTVAGVFMLLPDEETLSVDTDGEVTEEYNEEWGDSHLHQHGSEDSSDQSSSISDGREYEALNAVEVKEEPND